MPKPTREKKDSFQKSVSKHSLLSLNPSIFQDICGQWEGSEMIILIEPHLVLN